MKRGLLELAIPRQILRFYKLSHRDRLLLLSCTLVVLCVRIVITLFSYRTVSCLMPVRSNAQPSSPDEVTRVIWGVRNAARIVPGATCLTQALAGQLLLAWHGLPSIVRIGVARDAHGRLLAHAWLMSEGRIVIGGSIPDFNRYRSLADIDLGSN